MRATYESYDKLDSLVTIVAGFYSTWITLKIKMLFSIIFSHFLALQI